LTIFSKTSIVIGGTTYKLVKKDEKMTNAARKFKKSTGYYYAFNTAILIEDDQDFQLHHKSKLTPGVEIMPSWWFLKPIEKLAIDLGGTTGTLGREDHPVIMSNSDSISISPIICYESVYGEFVANSINLGAGLIFVITNDGWWGNTPGYKQHFLFSVLRAIETRRSVARSANTGNFGLLINQRGDILPTNSILGTCCNSANIKCQLSKNLLYRKWRLYCASFGFCERLVNSNCFYTRIFTEEVRS